MSTLKNDPEQKISSVIRIAKLEDAKKITTLFKNAYNSKYPFKQLEDINEIKSMILSPNYQWLVFEISPNDVVGCIGAKLDYQRRKGYLFGFVITPKLQGKHDSLNAFIYSLYYLWRKFRFRILIWTSEVRTFNSTPQFANNYVGLKPIAFLPNKDIFSDKRESEFLTVIFSKNVLKKLRKLEKPRIIRQVLKIYAHSNKIYSLGNPKIENPRIKYNPILLKKLQNGLIVKEETDRYENKRIHLSFHHNDSFFKFQYNHISQNCEYVDFKTKNAEELEVFLTVMEEFKDELGIKYFEIYASAYKPTLQKILYNHGLKPRGYIPALKFDIKDHCFEDEILFNFYKEEISPKLLDNLIKESQELYNRLDDKFNILMN